MLSFICLGQSRPQATFNRCGTEDMTKATPRGFEPLRAEPNGFLVHHLNHSVTVSMLPLPKRINSKRHALALIVKHVCLIQHANNVFMCFGIRPDAAVYVGLVVVSASARLCVPQKRRSRKQSLPDNKNMNMKYTQAGSNRRPSACEADVIATRPWVRLLNWNRISLCQLRI